VTQVPGDGEGDTEVGDVCPKVAVEQDVARLDVEVQDPPVAVLVEVRERPGHVDGNAEPPWPSQEAPLLVAAVEDPPVQRPVLEEGVDQVEVALVLEAVAEEAHQAAVVHVRHDGDLSQEVSLPDRLVAGDPLDGHCPAVREEASVDFGGAAATHHGTEVSDDGSDLVVRELAWQLLDVGRGLLHLHLHREPCILLLPAPVQVAPPHQQQVLLCSHENEASICSTLPEPGDCRRT